MLQVGIELTGETDSLSAPFLFQSGERQKHWAAIHNAAPVSQTRIF